MTLTRSNPEPTRLVIDRNDDSPSRPIRVGVVGAPGLFVDVLIGALLGSRIAAWRIAEDPPAIALRDRDDTEMPDLVLFVGEEGMQPQYISDRGLPLMLLNGGGDPGVARSWIDAGAVSVFDPSTADFDELVSAIRSAAGDSVAAATHRRRELDKARRAAQVAIRGLESTSIINSDDAPH